MSKPLFAIRPEPGLSATITAGQRQGLDIFGEPLTQIRPVAWEMPDPDSFDGILLGSANALRHGGSALERLREKPAYVVGKATADAARMAGFTIGGVGSGGLQGLLDELAGQELVLLRIAGAEHVPLNPPDGITLLTGIAYESVPCPISPDFAARLQGGGVVLLHSAAAACHFAAECQRVGIERNGLALAALGPRIAAAAGEGWAACRSADIPQEDALLALATDMCQ
ncbi:hypothetical protein MB02_06130 [Croceicoccus estronivorus]|uniref:uroporphyrinogen-III synthase n=1 Tax=Croceicoccus estronivorus TaxID=1172626 RepID=UPI0008325678|nr:uroporphyrinogen-III synthase [Croceicoccus estronivorus]OCC25010.1 hypothetical protein MB02_06130 [Croceicoccus estronivorus]